jgi:type I restriction enzyme S subunit
MKLTPDPTRVLPEFLYFLFSGPAMQREILNGTIGSSVPGFNLGRLRSLGLLVPPIEEQRAIVRVLVDADQSVGALERLLAKKRNVVDAAAHVLLAGDQQVRRSKGRSNVCLGEIAITLKGSGLAKSELSGSGRRPCLLYGELFTTYGRVIERVVSRTDGSGGTLSRIGDVLMPGSTTTEAADLAIASALLQEGVALGGDTLVIRARHGDVFDPTYLAYYLSNCRRREIAALAQGSTIVHLYGRHLADLSLQLPAFQEQVRVAAILHGLDSGIAVTKLRLQKARAIRRGMMQELLAGRMRCPVTEAVSA